MIRLFIRFYLGVVAAIFLSLVLGGILLDQQYQKIIASDYQEYTESLHRLLEQKLTLTNINDWNEEIKKISKTYPFHIEVISFYDLPVSQRYQLNEKGYSVVIEPDLIFDDVKTHYRLNGTEKVVRYIEKNIAYEEYSLIVLMYFLLVMLALAIVVYLLANPIARDISELVNVSKNIGEGDLNTLANEKAPYPMNQLAKSMNLMASQLKQLLKEQEVMTGAASHELKTPIANLRFALDMTRSKQTLEELFEHIEEMDQDVDDMEVLVNELLVYARIKQGINTSEKETINLYSRLDHIRHKLFHYRIDIEIELRADKQLLLAVHTNKFDRLIINLLRNAQKYAENKIQIHVYQLAVNPASPSDFQVEIHIDDDGPGIPKNQREDVFLPFKRLDQSRSKDSGGHGLGLAIAERIVQQHQGRITISDSPLGGARFNIIFPR